MQSAANTFVITRDDIGADSVRLIAEGLRIGRLQDSDIWLNHPAVARLHAGINNIEGYFYLINLSASNPTTVNGCEISFNEAEALTDGDEIQIGPYFLDVKQIEPKILRINVFDQSALNLGRGEPRHKAEAKQDPLASENRVTGSSEGINALQAFWDKRTRERVRPLSPLSPRTAPRLGKARFNWAPTRDLVPVWSPAIITCMLLVVALLSFLAALRFPEFLSPRNVIPDWRSSSVSDSLRGMFPYRLLLYGTGGALLILVTSTAARVVRDGWRMRRLLEEPFEKRSDRNKSMLRLSKEVKERYDRYGPDYPHPVVIADLCIGCHACIDACPHDVFAMVANIAVPVAIDQCMEDTSCQVVCPVDPKACIVVNTTREIRRPPVPTRDNRFMTNVPGCYLVGDLSGIPLIKNAVNEGADVINHIAHELKNSPLEPKAEFDVAIVGVGPAGLSAAVMAKQHNLRYIAIEQDKVLSTIEAYPRDKYVFFKPEVLEARGGIPIVGGGDMRETILESWLGTMSNNGVVINEQERCKAVKRAENGDYFMVQTQKAEMAEPSTYNTRRIILALGNRGVPMRLGVPGEEIRVTRNCVAEDKVQYKLSNPEDYRCKKIMVVGAGNGAIEAAVNLVARRRGNQIKFRPPEEINEVTLVVRSGFTNDIKFVNKMQVYDCIDEGKIQIFFGTTIKEIREDEVVLMSARMYEATARIKNDYVLALIGGARPTKFLESIGITIPDS